MDSIIAFALQALFAYIFLGACVSVWEGNLRARADDSVLPPYRIDVLRGARARLVAVGLLLLMAMSFALSYGFNTILFANTLYTNFASIIIGGLIYLFERKLRKLK